jgi:translocation protein SEC63
MKLTGNPEKHEAGAIAVSLNESLTAISLAFGNLVPLMGTFRASQNVMQAIPHGQSPLLQLPYFTPSVVKAVEGEHAKSHLTVQKFMDMPESERRSLTVGRGLLSEEQLKTATSVARQMPGLSVSKAFFKVMGEKVITPSSLVQLVVKGRFIPPGTTDIPEVNELDLEDVDPDEDDLDALLGRKPPRKKGADGKRVEDKVTRIQPPLAHAPYVPRDHSPRWHVFLADSKQGKIAVPPFTFTTFDKPIFDEDGRPTFNMQTLKMQFQAPPQVGVFSFVLHIVCDSYLGFDTKVEIALQVDDPAKAAALAEEDDISEPEEGKSSSSRLVPLDLFADSYPLDSLAGQMQALKTGVPPAKKKKSAAQDDSSEDDESDTDGDVDDTSETDTDTDTDGE